MRIGVILCLYLCSHVALASNTIITINQSVINGLFKSMGAIHSDLKFADIYITNPRIIIDGDNSTFSATALGKNSLFGETSSGVTGKISITPDLDNDVLKINIHDVVIEKIFFVKNIKISEWYNPSFDFPVQIPKKIEILGNTIQIKQINPHITMSHGEVDLHTDMLFSPENPM
jgi:hypothetical protein